MTTPKPNLTAAALRYAALGWPVLPLHTPDHDGGCSCERGDCPKPGKHPRTRNGRHDASINAARICAWWAAWPDANVGVATGRLVVFDVDGAHGRAAMATFEHAHRRLPPTLTAASGRGAHLYRHARDRLARDIARLRHQRRLGPHPQIPDPRAPGARPRTRPGAMTSIKGRKARIHGPRSPRTARHRVPGPGRLRLKIDGELQVAIAGIARASAWPSNSRSR